MTNKISKSKCDILKHLYSWMLTLILLQPLKFDDFRFSLFALFSLQDMASHAFFKITGSPISLTAKSPLNIMYALKCTPILRHASCFIKAYSIKCAYTSCVLANRYFEYNEIGVRTHLIE